MSSKERIRRSVCISTSKPNDSIGTMAGGSSLTIVCPFTGSVHASMKVSADMTGKLPIGVSSVSLFPSSFSSKESLALAFGSSAKKDDTYAMLATFRPTATAPTIHWKCRLPEAQMAGGLLVSMCGNYIVGGGASGNIYVWKSLGGTLLSTFKAHYRAVSCMAWSFCGRALVSGGADGIIHAFSLLSMVAYDANESSIQPFRTFSHHQLPISTLKSMPSGRMVSGSEDGGVTIVELFSEQVLVSLQLPHPVTSLDATAHRLFVGTQLGTIYCIDLDQYALHQTRQQGAVIVAKDRNKSDKQHVDAVFGGEEFAKDDSFASYQVELRGHDRPVTAIAVIFDYKEEWLISGDQAGVVRVWDMASRACVRTMHMWSQNKQGSSSGVTANAGQHPVASITVLEDYTDSGKTSDSIFNQMNQHQNLSGRNQSFKNLESVVNQLKPLQRFTEESPLAASVTIKLANSKRMLWQNVSETHSDDVVAAIRKRLKRSNDAKTESDIGCVDDKDAEIQSLREELAIAKQALEQKTK